MTNQELKHKFEVGQKVKKVVRRSVGTDYIDAVVTSIHFKESTHWKGTQRITTSRPYVILDGSWRSVTATKGFVLTLEEYEYVRTEYEERLKKQADSRVRVLKRREAFVLAILDRAMTLPREARAEWVKDCFFLSYNWESVCVNCGKSHRYAGEDQLCQDELLAHQLVVEEVRA